MRTGTSKSDCSRRQILVAVALLVSDCGVVADYGSTR